MNNMQRNPFFLPSGFEPQEIINIFEAKRDNKKRLDKIKKRKRAERKKIKQARDSVKSDRATIKVYDKIIKLRKSMTICNKGKPSKKSAKTFQIQSGSKFAKEIGVVAQSEKTNQIQRGFDLAKKWGWDGINRPYTPIIMSVFGGSKRKNR